MNEAEKIRSYFEKNSSCLKINNIEIRAGVPLKTLDHFVTGRRGLPEDAAKKIVKVLEDMNWKD